MTAAEPANSELSSVSKSRGGGACTGGGAGAMLAAGAGAGASLDALIVTLAASGVNTRCRFVCDRDGRGAFAARARARTRRVHRGRREPRLVHGRMRTGTRPWRTHLSSRRRRRKQLSRRHQVKSSPSPSWRRSGSVQDLPPSPGPEQERGRRTPCDMHPHPDTAVSGTIEAKL